MLCINQYKISTKFFSLLLLLLGLTCANGSQYGKCDYQQVIKVGKLYNIFSPKFPFGNYDPGTNCRWTVRSTRPINMTCSAFRIPESHQCSVDVVVIQSSSAPGRRYCGTRSFTIISSGNQIITELYSSSNSSGGQFLCSVQTVKTISDGTCRCGWKNQTRVGDGIDTSIDEYPMMARLLNFMRRIVFCSATIINPKQVITAAHCVDGMDYGILRVLVGEHSTQEFDVTQTTLYRTAGFVIHPQYSRRNLDYNIAIVNIEGEIEFNELVGPACLPFEHSQDSFAGNYVDYLGWDAKRRGERILENLRVFRVSIIPNQDCSTSYPHITTRHMCTLKHDRNACHYESGSPILWTNPATQRIVLVAIGSYANICGNGTPLISSRVGVYIDWILLQTPEGFRYGECE